MFHQSLAFGVEVGARQFPVLFEGPFVQRFNVDQCLLYVPQVRTKHRSTYPDAGRPLRQERFNLIMMPRHELGFGITHWLQRRVDGLRRFHQQRFFAGALGVAGVAQDDQLTRLGVATHLRIEAAKLFNNGRGRLGEEQRLERRTGHGLLDDVKTRFSAFAHGGFGSVE